MSAALGQIVAAAISDGYTVKLEPYTGHGIEGWFGMSVTAENTPGVLKLGFTLNELERLRNADPLIAAMREHMRQMTAYHS